MKFFWLFLLPFRLACKKNFDSPTLFIAIFRLQKRLPKSKKIQLIDYDELFGRIRKNPIFVWNWFCFLTFSFSLLELLVGWIFFLIHKRVELDFEWNYVLLSSFLSILLQFHDLRLRFYPFKIFFFSKKFRFYVFIQFFNSFIRWLFSSFKYFNLY